MQSKLIVTFGAAACLLAGQAAAADDGRDAAPLPAGWSEIDPGGATICARGGAYAFFVRQGQSDKVVIDFIGGGACWNAETCDATSSTFTDSVDSLRQQVQSNGLHGVYDTSNPANPYKDYTHVVVPYCTGDVHWGSADVTYTRQDGSTFLIHHRGAANAQAVLDWVKGHLTPQAVLVTGCSAGSYGSIFWTPKVREAFPTATLHQFGDSGAGILPAAWQKASFPLWNVTAAAPAWVPGLDPAQVDYTTLSLSEFYGREASHYPDVHFAQFNDALDFVQSFFYVKMGGTYRDWSPAMFASIAAIHARAPNFNSYVGGGVNHCATPGDGFYSVTTNNVKLVDWLSDYLSGAAYRDVQCTNCASDP